MKRKSQIINHESAAAIGDGTGSFEFRRSKVRKLNVIKHSKRASDAARQAIEQLLTGPRECCSVNGHIHLNNKLCPWDREELAELLDNFANSRTLEQTLNLRMKHE